MMVTMTMAIIIVAIAMVMVVSVAIAFVVVKIVVFRFFVVRLVVLHVVQGAEGVHQCLSPIFPELFLADDQGVVHGFVQAQLEDEG